MIKKTNPGALEGILIADADNENERQLVQQSYDFVELFVVVINLKGNIVLINRSGRELLGYSNDEIIGKDFIGEFIIESKRAEAKEFFNNVIKDRVPNSENIRFYLKTRNKWRTILEAKNNIIRDKANNVAGIIISGKNITSHITTQNDLRNDINLYQLLTNNVPGISLFLFDDDLRFIMAKGEELNNFGFTSENLEGKTIHEIHDPVIKKIWTPLFRSAISNHKIFTEYQYQSCYYQISVLPVVDNNNEIFMGIAINQNITESKETIRRLRKLNTEAVKANITASDFLARVSHEIRIPLSSIIGFIEQLSNTNLDSKQEEYLKIIEESSEHLMLLINDILAFSKIESGEIHIDRIPFKINHTIEQLYHSFSFKAKEKNLGFVYNVDERLDIVLIGDPFRLRQILINLLNNAIKFTYEGYVELGCYLEEENKSEVRVRFEITDTGIGIGKSDQKRIFRRFIQVDTAASGKYRGTGLGLTICKNLVEMQHGTLSVSSKEGIGSTFYFVIPYKKGRETDMLSEENGIIDQETLKDKKVLLVDDDNFNRLLGKTLLEKFNCSFDIAVNGKEAKTKLNRSKYDIVLLDMHMPEVSGIEVAKYIRDEKYDTTTKILAVTAAVLKREIVAYYNAGIDDFIIKPFKETALFCKVCNVLQIKNHFYKPVRAEIELKEELIQGPYDLSELKSVSDGNEELTRKMLDIFIGNAENAISTFQELLKTKKWKEIGETAHKLLPSFRHLKAETLVSYLLELKTKTLIEKNYKPVPELVNVTIEGMKELINELENEIKL